MADRQGFEPWRRSPAYTLSRRAPSTTRPPVHQRGLARPLGDLQEACATIKKRQNPSLQNPYKVFKGKKASAYCARLVNPSCHRQCRATQKHNTNRCGVARKRAHRSSEPIHCPSALNLWSIFQNRASFIRLRKVNRK
jgi:hypothetical protein